MNPRLSRVNLKVLSRASSRLRVYNLLPPKSPVQPPSQNRPYSRRPFPELHRCNRATPFVDAATGPLIGSDAQTHTTTTVGNQFQTGKETLNLLFKLQGSASSSFNSTFFFFSLLIIAVEFTAMTDSGPFI
ncbi:hypothetical protein LXL04_007611 [Taraxacum kok-saghyz]